MGRAVRGFPWAVPVSPAGIGMFPFWGSGSLLQIHFIPAVPTEQKARKKVYLIGFGWAVAGLKALLGKGKGLFIHKRLMGILKEIPFFYGVFLGLFGLI